MALGGAEGLFGQGPGERGAGQLGDAGFDRRDVGRAADLRPANWPWYCEFEVGRFLGPRKQYIPISKMPSYTLTLMPQGSNDRQANYFGRHPYPL